VSAISATIDWSNGVRNQLELGQTNAAGINQTLLASSVFPECHGFNPALELCLSRVSTSIAPLHWSADVCNQHELGPTNVATMGQTMLASSVFPECRQSPQPLTG